MSAPFFPPRNPRRHAAASRRILGCFFAFLALAVAARAQAVGQPSEALDYSAVLRLAEEKNPTLVQARANLAAAEGRLAEARLYPNPYVEGESDGFDDRDEARSSVMVGQPVIVGKRRTAEIGMRQADLDARRRELEQVRREVLRQAGELYVAMLYHKDNLALAWSISDDADRVRQAAQALAERGVVPASDLRRATAAAEEAYLDVTRHIAEVTFAGQQLEIALAGQSIHADQVVGRLLTEQVNAELRDARDHDVSGHPELLAASERIEVERRAERLARAEVVPDITLRVGGGYDGRDDETFAAAGFMVPIPLWDRNQGRVREARALAERAVSEREDMERRLEIGVLELSQRINELDTFVQGYATAIVPAREQAYADVTRAYAAGETTIHDIMAAQEELFAARRQLLTNRWLLSEAHVRLRYWLDADQRPDLFAVPE